MRNFDDTKLQVFTYFYANSRFSCFNTKAQAVFLPQIGISKIHGFPGFKVTLGTLLSPMLTWQPITSKHIVRNYWASYKRQCHLRIEYINNHLHTYI